MFRARFRWPPLPRRSWPALRAGLGATATVLALTVAPAVAPPAHAAPRAPASDDEVVERLPARPDAAQQARRAALARDPAQLPIALAVARESIDQARREGDPRALGSAQAALAPWWRDPQAPAPVRLLRATVLQSQHDFDAARADLDGLLADAALAPPLQAQALLTRASLHQLHGRFDDARRDCQALRQTAGAGAGPAVQRVAQACLLELQSLTGDPQAARRGLDALALAAAGASGPDPWLALLQAELAERLGDDAAAERHYAAATAVPEVYALAAQADWLLDRGRDRDALSALARGPDAADALQLRRAIAWQRLGDPRAAPAVASVRERLAALRQRGDRPHLREEARLALDLDHDAPRALALAWAQWGEQQEPADAVLLWRAAKAAGAADDRVPRALAAWLPDPARADVRLAAATSTPARTTP